MSSKEPKIAPTEQVRLLKIARDLFTRRVRELRHRQYQIAAIERVKADKQRAEELLKKMTAN